MDERDRTGCRPAQLAQRRLTIACSLAPASLENFAAPASFATRAALAASASFIALAAFASAAPELEPTLTAGTFFRPAVNISHTPSVSSLPRSSAKSLVLDPHGPALLFWVEAVPHTGGIAHELALARYIPVAGWDTTLTPIGRWEGDPSIEPACALDPSRTLHLVWLEQRAGNRLIQGLHFRLATGEMTGIEVISDSTFRAADPAVSADGAGHAHVVWSELDRGKSRIAYREWTPEEGWLPIAHLPSVSGESAFGPDVASAESGVVRVVWQEAVARGGRVGCTTRAPGGAWDPARFLSPDQPGWYVSDPLLAQAPEDEAATAVWQTSDGTRTRILACDLAGAAFGSPDTVADGPDRVSHPVAARDAGGIVHVLWISESAAGSAVMYDRRTPGAPPGTPRPLTLAGSGPYESPTIAADGDGRVTAAWIDRGLGNGDVLVRSGVSSFGRPLTPLGHAPRAP